MSDIDKSDAEYRNEPSSIPDETDTMIPLSEIDSGHTTRSATQHPTATKEDMWGILSDEPAPTPNPSGSLFGRTISSWFSPSTSSGKGSSSSGKGSSSSKVTIKMSKGNRSKGKGSRSKINWKGKAATDEMGALSKEELAEEEAKIGTRSPFPSSEDEAPLTREERRQNDEDHDHGGRASDVSLQEDYGGGGKRRRKSRRRKSRRRKSRRRKSRRRKSRRRKSRRRKRGRRKSRRKNKKQTKRKY